MREGTPYSIFNVQDILAYEQLERLALHVMFSSYPDPLAECLVYRDKILSNAHHQVLSLMHNAGLQTTFMNLYALRRFSDLSMSL
jgi:hypothetical protein